MDKEQPLRELWMPIIQEMTECNIEGGVCPQCNAYSDILESAVMAWHNSRKPDLERLRGKVAKIVCSVLCESFSKTDGSADCRNKGGCELYADLTVRIMQEIGEEL